MSSAIEDSKYKKDMMLVDKETQTLFLPDSEDDVKKKSTDLESKLLEFESKHEKLTEKVKQLKTQLRTEKDKWMRLGRDWKNKYEDLERSIKESTEYSYKESSPDDSVQYEWAGDKEKSYIHEKEVLALKESLKSTVISKDESQQERPHNTADVASNAVIQGQRRHDQTSDTEEKLPMVDNDSMGKGIASHTVMKNPFQGQTSESASDGICSEGRRNLSHGDVSHVLPHTESPITFLDKGNEIWEAQESKLKLSSQAAARMTHNNPYITDLSDQNRPTKISERYSELYDNQWTDAFELLQTKHHLSETEATEVLLDVLFVSFHECKEARRLQEGLSKALKRYIGEDEDSEDVTILEVMRTLKGTKRNIKKMQEEFNQHVHSKLTTKKFYQEMLPDIRPYMDECVEICLLMNIQEPPVELRGLELLSGSAFDLSAFQSYTESGNKIKYIVWPAMYLYQDGPLLRKGVAQGMRDSSNVLRPTDAYHDATKNEFTT